MKNQTLPPHSNVVRTNDMNCPDCNANKHQVLETRIQADGTIKRRRKCTECDFRFVTQERILSNYPLIIKKDGTTEVFNKQKLKKGLQLACQKRPVSLSQIHHIVEKIAGEVKAMKEKDLSALWLGKRVMEELKEVDDVAYVRFASVYRSFNDIKEFVDTLSEETLYTHKNQKTGEPPSL